MFVLADVFHSSGVLVHPLGAGRSPTDELGRKRRMTQFILRPRSVHFMCILFNLFTVK